MTKQELLAVLDMSKNEQDRWCALNTNRKSYEYLANLAFRLRDEAIKISRNHWEQGVHKVYHKAAYRRWDNISCWMMEEAEPIHWIIAALIAKESK